MEESIERESMVLLKDQVENPTYSMPILKGLVENIRVEPAYNWVAYVLTKYFKV